MPARLFDPSSNEAFKLSRSGLEEFVRCARCFYLNRRLGVKQPSTPPFQINKAVDQTLKREFDVHRAAASKHPLMEQYGLDAVPFAHAKMNEWRENFKGVQALHKPTNLLIFGAVDDIWVNPAGELLVVDYKATAKGEAVKELGDQFYHDSYRRQMEIYQWLLRQNDFKVSNTGYFVYCTGNMNAPSFDGKIEFEVHLIPYDGSDEWIEGVILGAKACLVGEELPDSSPACEYCLYRQKAAAVEGDSSKPATGQIPTLF